MNKKYARSPVLLAILIMTVTFLCAQQMPRAGEDQSPGEIPKGSEPVLRPHNPRYLLGIGDTIEISFRFTPEFDQAVTIQPDGFINLRDLPDMRIVGKSLPELNKMLQKAYSSILHDPVITLKLKDFEKPYFIAGGQVEHPGKYDLRGITTAIQAVEIAGGFKNSSKHSQVLLFRRLSDQWTEVKEIDMKAMLKSGDLSEDLILKPGDLIFVPQSTLSKIERFIPSMSLGAYLPR
jgi:polysaccharide export outer membrane protein